MNNDPNFEVNSSNDEMDQLDRLVNRQADLLKEKTTAEDKLDEIIGNSELPQNEYDNDVSTFEDPLDDVLGDDEPFVNGFEIDYGDDDLQKEIEAEELAEKQALLERQKEAAAIRAQNEDSKPKTVDISTSESYQKEAVNFQTDKAIALAHMNEAVKRKYGIKTEEIQVPVSKQRFLTGELLEIYENMSEGDTIPKEYEDLILSYWVKGSSAENPPAYITEETTSEFISKEFIEEQNLVVNINVEAGQDVTVNIDDSISGILKHTNEVIINVREVDFKEMKVTKVIENSPDLSVIEVFENNIGNTPITLFNSSYRCVMKPVNWGKMITLGGSSSNSNIADMERKQWSVIFEQMTNVSIGNFKPTLTVDKNNGTTVETSAFEHFLKSTSQDDKALMMWAIIVSTSAEIEKIEIDCWNKACGHTWTTEYSPRSICHVDIEDEQLKERYRKTHNVSVGDEASEHWQQTRGVRKVYQIPDSQWLVEIGDADAYTHINKTIPLMHSLNRRYTGEEDLSVFGEDYEIPAELAYIRPHVMYVKSLSKIVDGVEYRYTNWEAIENILVNVLTMEESDIIINTIQQFATDRRNAINFYLSDVRCPKCNDSIEKYYIDQMERLLFQIAQRQQNTKIKLIEMP